MVRDLFAAAASGSYRNVFRIVAGLTVIFPAPGDVGVLAIPDLDTCRRLIPKNDGNKLPPLPSGAAYRKM